MLFRSYFHNGGNPEYFIGSADIMDRNLNRRIETLVQIIKPSHTKELEEILELSFSKTINHWYMDENDAWHHIHLDENGHPLIDIQNYFIERNRND